jgi:hypothetical protein
LLCAHHRQSVPAGIAWSFLMHAFEASKLTMKVAIAVCGATHYGQLTAATAHTVTCLSSAVVSKHTPQHIACGKIPLQYGDRHAILCPGEVCHHHGDGSSMHMRHCYSPGDPSSGADVGVPAVVVPQCHSP